MDDSRRIRLLLEGDARTLAEVRNWIRLAFGRLARLYTDDLEDLEQEVLLELLGALDQGRFRGESSLRTYVRAYAYHKILDLRRARERRHLVEISELELPVAEPSAYERLSDRQKLEMAMGIVEEMPEGCRRLWWLVQEGKSFRQIGAELGASEGSLRVRLSRCRQKALELRRRKLREAGEGSVDGG
ncbi:MAG: sigma-70 family RNA polymerase sigma factor [Holophagales bacterium]|nr:sigma-70 family RNA polymerase sigma factor [Holophagales bacterium]